MSASEPIAERRGYRLTDLSHATFSYVFIRADCESAARAVADAISGVPTDAFPPAPLPEEILDFRSRLLYQFKGHPWSLFVGNYEDHETLAPIISRASGIDVFSFVNEDVSTCSAATLFRKGEQVETLEWGYDYSDDFA